MKNLIVVFLVLILTVLNMGCQEVISDPVTVTLRYTATGDDLYTGQATTQDLRWSYEPITVLNWQTATVVPGLGQPLPSGETVILTVPNIPSDTVVYFAVVLCDEDSNCSGISNIYEMKTADITAPASVSDLRE